MAILNEKHWTYRLFVENAEVYLPFLEQADDRAEAEATAVADILRDCGVPASGNVLDVAWPGKTRDSAGPAGVPGYRNRPVAAVRPQGGTACRGGRGQGQFVEGDIQDVEALLAPEGPFDAFINMFTSHGYYGKQGDLSLFRQLRGLASPGAAMVLLTSHRDWLAGNFVPQGMDRAGQIRVLQRRTMDLETSTLLSDWEFYEGQGESLNLRLRLAMEHRVYSLCQLQGLLDEAGWHCLRAMGSDRNPDFELDELTSDSKTMWVVARAGDA